MPLVLPEPGDFPVMPLSALAQFILEPAAEQITRRNAERANTVQAFLLRGLLPEPALLDVRARIDAAEFDLPEGVRLEIGGRGCARLNAQHPSRVAGSRLRDYKLRKIRHCPGREDYPGSVHPGVSLKPRR